MTTVEVCSMIHSLVFVVINILSTLLARDLWRYYLTVFKENVPGVAMPSGEAIF